MSLDIVAILREMIEQLPRLDTPLFEIREALVVNPEFQRINQFTFRRQEIEITPRYTNQLEQTIAALERVRPLELTLAPRVVAVLPVDDRSSLLVKSYWACPGERLLGVEQSVEPFRPEACELFQRDLRRLGEQGWMHRYVRGFPHWLVSERTGTLLLDSWGALAECEPTEIETLLAAADTLLKHHG